MDSTTSGFLFADLRGYTAYVEQHGAGEAVELLYSYRAIVRDVIARFHGAEIKTEGDSFYVVFAVVSDAVRAALDIQASAAQAHDRPISVGIGVHAGEAVQTPEGYVGSSVNIAARLCSIAAAGEVIVSETVRSLVGDDAGFEFDARGHQRLKGVSEPVTVYLVVAAGGVVAPRGVRPVRRLVLAAVVGFVAVAVVAVGGLAAALSGPPAPSPTGASATPGQGSPPPITPSPSVSAPVDEPGRIVFTATAATGGRGPGTSDVYLANSNGTDLLRLAHNDAANATVARWSADGSEILFMQVSTAGTTLRAVRPDGTGLRTVADLGNRVALDWFDNDQGFAVAPDGSAAAFGCRGADLGSRICLVDLVSAAITPLTRVGFNADAGVADFNPTWSADGARIVFSRILGATDLRRDLAEVVLSDGSQRALTNSSRDDEDWPDLSTDKLAYVRLPASNSTRVAGDIWVQAGNGPSVARLTDTAADERWPSWSPSGSWIVYSSNDTADHSYALFAVRPDGQSAAQMLALAGYDLSAPDWAH